MAFPWQDSLTSLGVGLGHQATGYVNLLLIQGLIGTYDWQHRIFTMPQAWWMTVALFLILDFVYYWYHRAAHEVNAQHTPFTERNDPDCICSIGMDPVHVL
jgi:sterol desaturase/sphingolipid hydroxylase (fatty acid hydroxylase superfamily)